MFDCHTHSKFSTDSSMPAEIACETAIKIGLEGLAITDHLDIEYPGFEDEFLIDFGKYSGFIDGIKLKYRSKLKVLKGIEVGLQPHVNDKNLEIVNSHDFDLVIASVHIIDRMDPYVGDYYKGKSKKEADIRYLEEIYRGTVDFTNYDVLGHIGYIRRYGCYDDNTLRHCDYSDLIDSILKNVIELGKVIEINTSGYRSGLGSPMPDFDIARRFRELGGEAVTLGSDAHSKEQIGLNFELAAERLKEIGFKYAAYFENRRPVFYKL